MSYKEAYNKAFTHNKVVEALKKGELSGSLLDDLSQEQVLQLLREYDFEEYILNIQALRYHSTTAILYGALCLEALINDYAAIKLGKTYFNTHIEWMRTVSKWEIVPRIVTGERIFKNNDSEALKNLQELFKLRNNLAHPKSTQVDNDHPIRSFLIGSNYLKVTIRAIKGAAMSLYLVDNKYRYLEDYKWLWGEKVEDKDETSSYISFISSFFGEI